MSSQMACLWFGMDSFSIGTDKNAIVRKIHPPSVEDVFERLRRRVRAWPSVLFAVELDRAERHSAFSGSLRVVAPGQDARSRGVRIRSSVLPLEGEMRRRNHQPGEIQLSMNRVIAAQVSIAPRGENVSLLLRLGYVTSLSTLGFKASGFAVGVSFAEEREDGQNVLLVDSSHPGLAICLGEDGSSQAAVHLPANSPLTGMLLGMAEEEKGWAFLVFLGESEDVADLAGS